MTIVHWPEITSFHNIRKFTKSMPDILNGNSSVTYKSKIKEHGTNAAIQIYNDRLVPQSRNSILSVDNDNCGFAKFVFENENKWLKIADDTDEEIIIYGEWIGPSIQKNVACSEIPNKSFAVFAAKIINEDKLIIEPYLLQDLVKDIPNTYVLPWHNEMTIDWSKSSDELVADVNHINSLVNDIEKNDIWIENTFGIRGVGEGLVFYPTSKDHLGFENFKNLVFKAKSELHKNIKNSEPAQVNPAVASSIDEFINMVLTEARLEQGAMAVQSEPIVVQLSFDNKFIGKFINWISADVQKETKDEMEASNLTWKQIQKPLCDKARKWYLEQINND